MDTDPLRWGELDILLNDGNPQNGNAANAGDGPKHIAWLTTIDVMGANLKLLLETHSGGGVYVVPEASFCVDLPEDSILGRHQRHAALPPRTSGGRWYSASGDQALLRMPTGCAYVAYDNRPTTSERLEHVACLRSRARDLDARPLPFRAYRPSDSARAVIGQHEPASTLVMIDPLRVKDIDVSPTTRQGMKHQTYPTLLFGARGHEGRGTREFDEAWSAASWLLGSTHPIEWVWRGQRTPREPHKNSFHLLIALPDREAAHMVLERLMAEHRILLGARSRSHGYEARVAPRWLKGSAS